MENLGKYLDHTIGQEYNLYSVKLSELRKNIKAAYAKRGITDFNKFDYESGHGKYDRDRPQSAKAADIFFHNNFIVTQGIDTKEPLVIDGFNRLFLLNAASEDQTVFVKDYPVQIPVRSVIWLLYQLNYWKKSRNRMYHMFDRGFCLYTYIRIGVNISASDYNGVDYFQIITRYTDARHMYNYDNYDSNTFEQNGRILFDNDHFFDDIALLIKLHSIKIKYIGDRKFTEDKFTPLPFYSLLSGMRNDQIQGKIEFNFDVKDVEKFLTTDKEMIKLSSVFFDKCNSNGKGTSRFAANDYFVKKYVEPVVLNKGAGKTDAELRKEVEKAYLKAKKDYVKISHTDAYVLEKDETVYRLNKSREGVLEVTKLIFRGTKEEVSEHKKIGLIRRTEKTIDVHYLFEMENGKIEEYWQQAIVEFNPRIILYRKKK